MIFVLDASAMIPYLRDEPGAGVVAEALKATSDLAQGVIEDQTSMPLFGKRLAH